MQSSSRTALLLNLGFLVVSSLAVASIGYQQWTTWSQSPSGLAFRLKGTNLSSSHLIQGTAETKTLFIVLRKGCHYCEDSLPFYKRLNSRKQTTGFGTRLAVIMPDSLASGGAVLSKAGIAIPARYEVSLNSIHVTATPTLMLVDQNQIVSDAWIGELSPEQENQVLERIQK